MSKLKLSSNYFNNYELAHNVLSKNEWFTESDWLKMAREGNLDQYITVLDNSYKITDKDKFYADYNYEFADDKTRIAALYNEVLADRTNTDTERERYVQKEDGTYDVEKFTASDYDYYKSIIKENNDINYNNYLSEQEKSRDDSANSFTKVMGTIASAGTEFVYGLTEQVDSILATIAGVGKGVGAAIRGENFNDEFVKTVSDENWRLFESLGVQDWIVNFEKKYTYVRDEQGNYTDFGKYLGGVCSTLGQMVPSMLAGKATGSASTALGLSSKLSGTLQSSISSLVFYQGVTGSSIREMYQNFAAEGLSVSSSDIVANATIKSALQYAVELGLAKTVLGGSTLDKLVFGRGTSTITSKTLTGAAGTRLITDFVKEGLEEVFQDTSDFLVDKAFGMVINENFGKISNLTFQSLIDAFVIGGITSFAGSAFSIATTKNVLTDSTQTNKKGEVTYKKLNKLASWEYGLDMQSFVNNYYKIQEQGKGLIKVYNTDNSDVNSKAAKEYAAAYTEMYAAYRMVTSIYNEIGEERFMAANSILSEITSMVNNGKFDSTSLKRAADVMSNYITEMDIKLTENSKDIFKKINATKIKTSVKKDDVIKDISELDNSTKIELEKLFEGDKTLKDTVLCEDGNNVYFTDGVLFVPIKYLDNAGTNVIYSTLAEQKLVTDTMSGKFKGDVLNKVLDTFKKVQGRNNATMEEAVYNMIFNDSFYRILLSEANKDMYQLLSSLIEIESSVVTDDLRTSIYKKKIGQVVNNMKTALIDYLVNQYNADYKLDVFTSAEIKKIAATRWCRNLYYRVLNNKLYKRLNNSDWNVLANRINSLPMNKSEKNKIWDNLKSDNQAIRTSAMNRIARYYTSIFTTSYDGKTYMPDNSLPNKSFNFYLQSYNLTISNFIDTAKNDEIKNTIIELYGEYNRDTLIKFRQVQFSQFVNNEYNFQVNTNGKIGIFANDYKQVGFSEYNSAVDAITSGTNLIERTQITKSHKKSSFVREVLSSDVDNVTASYLTINDVINNPNLLSSKIRSQIAFKYKDVNTETAFLYLRDYFVQNKKDTTIVIQQDGEYAFASVKNMYDCLKTGTITITEKTKITDIIKENYLYGRLKDLRIVITDKSIVAEYSQDDNTIYVSKYLFTKDNNYIKFAILHEFQHAIQVENSSNLGLNYDWLNSKSVSKTMRSDIIKDVRKHVPDLFKDVDRNSDTELKIVNDFVYYSTAEVDAYGVYTNVIVDFYPVVVKHDINGTKIILPWGSSYKLTGDAVYDISDASETSYYSNDTSLGDIDSQSIVETSNESEKRLLNEITEYVNRMLDENNDIADDVLVKNLTAKYPFVPSEVFADVINTIRDGRKPELTKLSEKLTDSDFEESDVKKPQYRMYTEAENETDVVKSDGTTKWVEKRPRLDENGNVIRNSQGKIMYNYVYPNEKRYTSQKEAKGTNLEKYGYIKKYKRTQIGQSLKNFIIKANKGIDNKLWSEVKKGTITESFIMDYFRDADNIDDSTFKLINDCFFKNTKIKTFEELTKYVTEKTPKYYAVRAVLTSLGYSENLAKSTNINLLDSAIEILNKNDKNKNTLERIERNYYLYKGSLLDINEKNLRRLWMTYFDGSVQTGGYLATIAKVAAISKWEISGDTYSKTTKKLESNIAEDMTLSDVIEDISARDAFEYLMYSTGRREKVDLIMKVVSKPYVEKLLKNGATPTQISNEFAKKREQLMEMDDAKFTQVFKKYVGNLREDVIDKLFSKQIIVTTSGMDVNKLNNGQLNKLQNITDVIYKSARPSSAIVNNIHSLVRTIKGNLSSNDKKRFLKENSDIFDDDLNVKTEVYKKTNEKGRSVYKDAEYLVTVENRIRNLSSDVRSSVYASKSAMDYKKSMDRELNKLKRENSKLVKELERSKIKVYQVADETVFVNSDIDMPESFSKLIEKRIDSTAKSNTKFLVESDQRHIKTSYKQFIKENSDFLQSLSQQDADELVEFFINSELLPTTNRARQYVAYQTYLMTYLIKGNKLGQFILTEEQIKSLTSRLEKIVSISAQNLTNWREAMKTLNTEKEFLQSFAGDLGIEFSESDIDNLVNAVKTGNVKTIENAKQKLYSIGLEQYKGNKLTFLDKLVQFERLAMLSGPGTWVRNQVSNVTVYGGNILGEQIGTKVTNLVTKLLPKKGTIKTKQYKIAGTKVTEEVKDFIKTNILDNNFLNLIRDGINKYDTRKSTEDYTTDDSLVNLVINSIKTKILNENTFKSKYLNYAQKLVFKALSDDKAINKTAIRYFGKILVEDSVNLSKGLSTDVLNHLAEAYKLAAHDYMHKPNFITKMENELRRDKGDKAYFVYKQIFPFAAASWNWFVEGLNYTPYGLIKGIINFAKLENTVEKLEYKRQIGENVVSSRFAEYLAKRQIGKGIVGSVGLLTGIILAALGKAGIDEEDDKYKLFVNVGDDRVYIDISDIFGTQGVLLGIALATSLRPDKNKDIDWMSAIVNTLDVMMLDSAFSEIYNSFRYSTSFADWLIEQPFNFLNAFVPNFIKTFSSVSNVYKIQYSKGILGKLELFAVNSIPGLAYAFPTRYDPYTGEKQVQYKLQFLTNLFNKLSAIKIYPYNVSDAEKEAISLGVSKGPLTGDYTVNDEKVKLTSDEIGKLNEYYGKLNKDSLEELMSNKTKYKVYDEDKNSYVELYYKQMNDTQKKTVIERIMSNNGKYAKIYILTSTNRYKYYCSESEYNTLRKLGLTNIYKNSGKFEGFVTN